MTMSSRSRVEERAWRSIWDRVTAMSRSVTSPRPLHRSQLAVRSWELGGDCCSLSGRKEERDRAVAMERGSGSGIRCVHVVQIGRPDWTGGDGRQGRAVRSNRACSILEQAETTRQPWRRRATERCSQVHTMNVRVRQSNRLPSRCPSRQGRGPVGLDRTMCVVETRRTSDDSRMSTAGIVCYTFGSRPDRLSLCFGSYLVSSPVRLFRGEVLWR
jgi:hypothetical protein